jgi:hypothetical protein
MKRFIAVVLVAVLALGLVSFASAEQKPGSMLQFRTES